MDVDNLYRFGFMICPMLCQKTNMQLPLAGSVDGSVADPNPNGNRQPQGKMEGLVEDLSWYLRKIKSDPERYERYRNGRKEYRQRAKDKIQEYHKLKRIKASEKEKDRIRQHQRDSYHRNRSKNLEKLRAHWISIKSDPLKLERRNASKRKSYRTFMVDPEKSSKKRKENRDRAKRRRKEDIAFRIEGSCRALIKSAITRGFGQKAYRTSELLGCTFQELRDHIESQWRDGMSWSNYGRVVGKWCIDHIRPCASFDLTDPVQQRECFNWINLSPLWVVDNQKKSSRWNGLQYRNVKSSKTE